MRFISAMAVGLVAFASARPILAAGSDVPTDFVHEPELDTLVPYVGFNIGGGLSVPLSDAGDRFNLGGAFQVGVTYNFTRHLGVQAEYLYSGYSVEGDVLSSTGVDGHHSMQYGNLNAVYEIVRPRPFGVYVLGGPGIYYRRVEITEFAGTAVVPYCDPWLFFCYATPVGVEQVLGARSRTDFGLNAGVGVNLRLFEGPVRLYLEGRYHYIFGGDVDTPNGSININGQYLPFVLGLRL